MLTTIESWGIGGRESYHDQELRWVVFEDELADTAQSVSLFTRNLDAEHCKIGSYSILGDTLIQALTRGNFSDYYVMPSYRYYRIQGSRLQPIHPEREFPFMSVLRIDADFLAGCFYGSASEEDRAAFVKTQKETLEDYVPIDRTADHFTADDLDYLVNEVYAAHGKRFKGEKWQQYFGEKAWYKPVADDVEGQLSAIERSNIAFVRNVQSKVRQSEASYTHAKFSIGEYY
jgi:YARHG domain